MRTKKVGYNTFTNYEAIKFYVDFDRRGKQTSSLQLTWGGYAQFDEDSIRHDIGNYNVNIKRFFRSKVRDGYFKDDMIYINEIPDTLYELHRGLWFPKMFLFLEDTMDKSFVVDYLKTLFKPLSLYHLQHDNITFTHYKNGIKNNKSISGFIGK